MTISTHYRLEPRDILRLPPGTPLACDSGSVWITEDGALRDTVLEPGQSFRPLGTGRVLVYAFTPAQLHAA